MASFRHAFKLTAEEVKQATPPGTKVLTDSGTTLDEHGQGRAYGGIHLHPAPSRDRRDPLNLPFWRKIVILLLMGSFGFISTASSSIVSSALPEMVTAFAEFPEHGPPKGLLTFADLTPLLAVQALMEGAANLWFVPLSNKYGRRVIILISLLLLTIFSFWCAAAQSFESLLAARVFQGIGGATAETLAPDMVGRVFFVHQAGRAMAVYTFMLSIGAFIGGIVGGYIAGGPLGWRWIFWVTAIISGGLFVLSFLFLPETLFDRNAALREDQYSNPGTSSTSKEASEIDVKLEDAQLYGVASSEKRPTLTFVESLGFPKPRPGFVRYFIPLLLALRFPGTLMVMLLSSGLVALIVSISTAGAQVLSAPPYLWGANVGLINIAGLVGTILGALYTYLLTDWIIKRKSKRSVYGFIEPEQRLKLIVPVLVLATAGPIVFGFAGQNPSKYGWVGLAFGYVMVCFGVMQILSVGFNYIIDSYGVWAADCLTGVQSFRAIIGFAWTYFVGTWVTEKGTAQPFGIFGLLMGLFSMTLIPVWLYGKRLRIATTEWVQDSRHL